jgi:SEC-C motif-containing protein
MKKISPNTPCPCHSHKKYKKCCLIYHKGEKAEDALSLMRSRYSAYALKNALYIIKTTHPNNSDYTKNREKWIEDIELFYKSTKFLDLEILEFIEDDMESFVTFKVMLLMGQMQEKSRFLKVNDEWLYESGEFNLI